MKNVLHANLGEDLVSWDIKKIVVQVIKSKNLWKKHVDTHTHTNVTSSVQKIEQLTGSYSTQAQAAAQPNHWIQNGAIRGARNLCMLL